MFFSTSNTSSAVGTAITTSMFVFCSLPFCHAKLSSSSVQREVQEVLAAGCDPGNVGVHPPAALQARACSGTEISGVLGAMSTIQENETATFLRDRDSSRHCHQHLGFDQYMLSQLTKRDGQILHFHIMAIAQVFPQFITILYSFISLHQYGVLVLKSH